VTRGPLDSRLPLFLAHLIRPRRRGGAGCVERRPVLHEARQHVDAGGTGRLDRLVPLLHLVAVEVARTPFAFTHAGDAGEVPDVEVRAGRSRREADVACAQRLRAVEVAQQLVDKDLDLLRLSLRIHEGNFFHAAEVVLGRQDALEGDARRHSQSQRCDKELQQHGRKRAHGSGPESYDEPAVE
jgi:hypothetical protein